MTVEAKVYIQISLGWSFRFSLSQSSAACSKLLQGMMILLPPDLSLATAQLAPVPVTMTLNLPEFFGIRILAIVKGPNCNPHNLRHLVIEVAANVYGEELVLEVRYSKNVHRRSTIEMLAENYISSLRSLISYCQSSLP
ncbi:MAG TPA: hypothetical protein VF719_08440 [Abditibacteriaceae bacterium]|jgi:hypothetical protein